jgi:hypothetical protein
VPANLSKSSGPERIRSLRSLKEVLSARASRRWRLGGAASSTVGRTPDRSARDIAGSFRGTGTAVDEAIPAYSGLYPFFGGTGTWELLFTRHRLLARVGARVLVWNCYTGPSPTRQLMQAPLSALVVTAPPAPSDPQRRYGQVSVGGKRFWVPGEYWSVVMQWAEMEAPRE